MSNQLSEGLERAFAAVFIATSLLFPHALLAQNQTGSNAVATFVEISAEIEILEWSGTEGPRPESFEIHAVVGKNKWAVGELSLFLGYTNFSSFDGAKIVESSFSFGTNGSTGNRSSRTSDSSDGNPSQTVRASDHMDMVSRIAWLAFCSPATLNNPDHKLYPPWDFWKEYLDPYAFTQKVERFPDALGLPKSMVIISGGHQPIVDYRASGATNISGLLFPQDFYLLEYNPTRDKGWALQLLAHGRVRALAPVDALTSGTAAPAEHKTQASSDAEIQQSPEQLWVGRLSGAPTKR